MALFAILVSSLAVEPDGNSVEVWQQLGVENVENEMSADAHIWVSQTFLSEDLKQEKKNKFVHFILLFIKKIHFLFWKTSSIQLLLIVKHVSFTENKQLNHEWEEHKNKLSILMNIWVATMGISVVLYL